MIFKIQKVNNENHCVLLTYIKSKKLRMTESLCKFASPNKCLIPWSRFNPQKNI